MRSTLAWIVGLALLGGTMAWAGDDTHRLDGTSWKVEVNPDGMAKEKGEKDFHETLTFGDGKLMTVEGPKLGFETVPYRLSRSGDNDWSFVAEQMSGAQGKYVWAGTVHEGDVRGKLVWTKRDGSVVTYTFKGDKKE
jgi:hypothetical protein